MQKLVAALTLATLVGCIDTDFSPIVEPEPEPEAPDTGDGGADGEANPWPDDTPVGGLYGTLCETADSGLANVEILVEHAWGVARTRTNAEGYYELSELPAGEWMLIASGPEYLAQIPVLVPPNERIELTHPECSAVCDFDIPCIGLAEAVDRQAADLSYSSGLATNGLLVRNTSDDLDICLEDWMVAFSSESQDLLFGQLPSKHLAPGENLLYPYAEDVYGTNSETAWWCVERWQVIAPGSSYAYNGSLHPSGLKRWVRERTDTNRSGIEDHIDIVDGQLQAQNNIWLTEELHPIFLVGRARNLVRLTGPGSRPRVQVQVRNLGQQAGTGVITEVVPAGFNVSGITPAGRTRRLADGSTEIAWTVSLPGAEPDFEIVRPTRYHDAVLSYVVTLGDQPCEGRCVGNGAVAEWVDNDAAPWLSTSEPLIIEHCTVP